MQRVFLFDFDGTLADTLEMFEACVSEAWRRHDLGAGLSRTEFLAVFEHNMSEGLVRAGVPAGECAAFLGTLASLLRAAAPESRLFPGSGPALLELASSHPVFVVTSNFTEVVERVLAREGLASCLGGVLGSDVDPSKVRKIARVQEQYPAARIFYVGDTAGDMREAHRAGAVAVAVSWGWHSPERLRQAAADIVLDEPGDIVTLGHR